MKRLVNDFVIRNVFTTGEVAEIWGVAPRTVTKATDRATNKLPSYRIGNDRRIPRDELIRFMKANGMPLFSLEDPACPRILFVCASAGVAEPFNRKDFATRRAANMFDAGIEMQAFLPALVVLDYDFCPDADDICQKFQNRPTHPIVVGIGNGGSSVPHLLPDAFIAKSPSMGDLLEIDIGRLLLKRYEKEPV